MSVLSQVQKQADQLSTEDREGLLAYLIHSIPATAIGADDEEISRREYDMDSGSVELLSHEEFVRQVQGS